MSRRKEQKMQFPAEMMKGQSFRELMFEKAEDVDRIMPHLRKVGLDPKKAAKRLNAEAGRVVCGIRGGYVASYEDAGEEKEQSLKIEEFGSVPFFYTVVKVGFTDGYEGYTYRLRIPVPAKT